MEQSKHFQKVIALGNKIVEELSKDDNSYGITAKWMSQYVAELIEKSNEEKEPAKRQVIQKECCDTILKLWKYRSVATNRITPLSNLSSTLEIINSLVRKEGDRFSWQRFSPPEDSSPWGSFMNSLRNTVDDIVGIAISATVSGNLLDKEKEWLEHSELLSKEEREIIEQLDYLLTKSDTPFKIIITRENEPEVIEEPKNKMIQVFDKLESLINSQQEKLLVLREKVIGESRQ